MCMCVHDRSMGICNTMSTHAHTHTHARHAFYCCVICLSIHVCQCDWIMDTRAHETTPEILSIASSMYTRIKNRKLCMTADSILNAYTVRPPSFLNPSSNYVVQAVVLIELESISLALSIAKSDNNIQINVFGMSGVCCAK